MWETLVKQTYFLSPTRACWIQIPFCLIDQSSWKELPAGSSSCISLSCTLWHTNASYSSKMKDLKNKIWLITNVHSLFIIKMQERWFTSSSLMRVPGNEIITKFGGYNHIVKRDGLHHQDPSWGYLVMK